MKLSLITVRANNTLSAINANFLSLINELQNKVLYRNNPEGEPNALITDVDMNGNDILNANSVSTQHLLIDGVDVVPGIVDGPVISYNGRTGAVLPSPVDKELLLLDNVDNTSDLNKPISSATQTALNAKANSASPTLSNPTFTGTITGVTPTQGVYDAIVPTRQWVRQEMINDANIGSYISAHNNGVAQSVPNVTWTKINLSTLDAKSSTGTFSSSTYIPPGGRVVAFDVSVGFTAAPINTLTFVALYKNGALFKRGSFNTPGGTNPVQNTLSCFDLPNGSDFYELYAYQGSGGALNTDGTSFTTWFQAHSVQI